VPAARAGKGFQQYVPDFIFAPALATTILTTVTPILFDRYDQRREARTRRGALTGGAAAAGGQPAAVTGPTEAASASKKRA
jgi:spore maturation protein SpmA